MLSRQWLQGFLVVDAFLITILSVIALLGDTPQIPIAVAMFLWVIIHLWEAFRRRTPRPMRRSRVNGAKQGH